MALTGCQCSEGQQGAPGGFQGGCGEQHAMGPGTLWPFPWFKQLSPPPPDHLHVQPGSKLPDHVGCLHSHAPLVFSTFMTGRKAGLLPATNCRHPEGQEDAAKVYRGHQISSGSARAQASDVKICLVMAHLRSHKV